MGPLIILLTVGVIAVAWTRKAWRNRSATARRTSSRDSGGDGVPFYDSGPYSGSAEASAGHADLHCASSSLDFSGSCSSDGGGDGGGGGGDGGGSSGD